MGFCGSARRASNSYKAKKPQPKLERPHPDEKGYTVYVVSKEYAKERGWGGAGAIRVGPGAGEEGEGWCAFKINDTFPGQLALDGGHYYTDDVLAEGRKLKSGEGATMEDYFLHEVGGHEVLRWGHDADNAVMNSDIRKTRSASDYTNDRSELRSALMDAYPTIKVVTGTHP